MPVILGISAFYHDSAAALVVDGKIVAAAQEERFTRIKHTEVFPKNAIQYCLKEGGYRLDEVDAVVFYDKPFLKFERLLQTYYAFAPSGLVSFLKAIPVWIKEKLFLKKLLIDSLREIDDFDRKKLKLLFSEHHLSHAASAFYASPFNEAAIITIDGVGEWSTASIGIGKQNEITLLKEMEFPHSVGLLYSAFTYFLGFKVNSGEYKLMGLAPYGNEKNAETQHYISQIKSELVDIKTDGSIWLNQSYFSYATGLRMIVEPKWKTLFGFDTRQAEEELTQKHCNLAFAIQQVTEEIVLKMVFEARKLTNLDALCLAGGVALNCVANGKILQQKIFKHIYVQPASGDAGGSIGAALAVNHMYFNKTNRMVETDLMQGTYLGPDYSNRDVEIMNRRFEAVAKKYDDFEMLCVKISKYLSEGKVVGWFQGRMEFGPRALGNRSILGDARNPEMQVKMNLKIKFREDFRPFAPAVLVEKSESYFDLEVDSPFMMFVAKVKDKWLSAHPANYNALGIAEKLQSPRGEFHSITHLDGTARVQTVDQKSNPRFYSLLTEFDKISGSGMLINTSFNIRGEPIVCDVEDAYKCFMSTEMDVLVINDFVYLKSEQPNNQVEKWKTKFESD